MQNDDFIDENLDNAGSASDNNTVHKNLDLDVVLAEITAFAENMHTKNQHKKKICLRCMMIIPLVFMVLMFTMDTAKVVYLLLWVISLFIFCGCILRHHCSIKLLCWQPFCIAYTKPDNYV